MCSVKIAEEPNISKLITISFFSNKRIVTDLCEKQFAKYYLILIRFFLSRPCLLNHSFLKVPLKNILSLSFQLIVLSTYINILKSMHYLVVFFNVCCEFFFSFVHSLVQQIYNTLIVLRRLDWA